MRMIALHQAVKLITRKDDLLHRIIELMFICPRVGDEDNEFYLLGWGKITRRFLPVVT